MRWLLLALLLGAGCDDSDNSAPKCFGHLVAPGTRCCPNADFYGTPTGSCSPVGASCEPSASDTLCACEASGWQCRPAFYPRDLSFPDPGD